MLTIWWCRVISCVGRRCYYDQCLLCLPGSSPSGSRVIRSGDGVNVLRKNYLIRKERLGRHSVVGKFSGEKRLNNLVYMENQENSETRSLHHLRRPPVPAWIVEGAPPWAPSRVDLRSQGKINRIGEPPRSRWEFRQERGEREKTTREKPVFPGIGPISLFFRSTLILLVIHLGINVRHRVTQGQLLRPVSKDSVLCISLFLQGSHICLQYLLVWRPINILWPHLTFSW